MFVNYCHVSLEPTIDSALLMQFLFDLLQKHCDICRDYPVVCTNKCGVKDMPREKVCSVYNFKSEKT